MIGKFHENWMINEKVDFGPVHVVRHFILETFNVFDDDLHVVVERGEGQILIESHFQCVAKDFTQT